MVIKKFIEPIVFIMFTLISIILLRSPLIDGYSMFYHDAAHGYPVFKYFVDHLSNGELPLWNYIYHGGEPFYMMLPHLRFLNPLTILAAIFTPNNVDTVMLFNWIYFLKIMIYITGTYFFIRTLSSSLAVRLCTLPIIFFSSYFLVTMRQDGTLNQFFLCPWMIYIISTIIREKKYTSWTYWTSLAILQGLNWQSYFFTGPTLFLLAYIGCSFIFNKAEYLNAVKNIFKKAKPQLLVATIISIMMAAPNIALLIEKSDYVFPIRATEQASSSKAINIDYETIEKTGSFMKWDDLTFVLNPYINLFIKSSSSPEKFSENFLYLGIISWIFIFFAVFFSNSRHTKVWLYCTIFMGIICLGPNTPLYPYLYKSIPILWFYRNGGCLNLYLGFSLIVLFTIGLDNFLKDKKNSNYSWQWFLLGLAVTCLCIKNFQDMSGMDPKYKSEFINNLIQFSFLITTIILVKPVLTKMFKKAYPFIVISGLFIYLNLDLLAFFNHANNLYLDLENIGKTHTVNTNTYQRKLPKIENFSSGTIPTKTSLFFYSDLLKDKGSIMNGLGDGAYFSGRDSQAFYYLKDRKKAFSFIHTKGYSRLINSNINPELILGYFFNNNKNFSFFQYGLHGKDETLIEKAKTWEPTTGKNFILISSDKQPEHLKNFENYPDINRNLLAQASHGNFSFKPAIKKIESSSVKVDKFKNTSIELTVNSAKDQILYWANGWHKGWQATVNSKSQEIYRANLNFISIPVAKGISNVTFNFKPRFMYTVYLFQLAILFGVLIILLANLPRRKTALKKY